MYKWWHTCSKIGRRFHDGGDGGGGIDHWYNPIERSLTGQKMCVWCKLPIQDAMMYDGFITSDPSCDSVKNWNNYH